MSLIKAPDQVRNNVHDQNGVEPGKEKMSLYIHTQPAHYYSYYWTAATPVK